MTQARLTDLHHPLLIKGLSTMTLRKYCQELSSLVPDIKKNNLKPKLLSVQKQNHDLPKQLYVLYIHLLLAPAHTLTAQTSTGDNFLIEITTPPRPHPIRRRARSA
jgi:hypothetical protein